MNDEIQGDGARAKNDFRKALILYGVLIGCVLVAYFMGGKALIETAQTAQENEKLRLDFQAQQQALENQKSQLTSGLQQLTSAFSDSNNQQGKDVQDMVNRMQAVERLVNDLLDQINPLLNMAQKQEMKETRQKADIAAAYVLAKQTKESFDQLQNELAQWELQRKQLLTNQDGSRIAANPELLSRFRALVSSVGVDQGQLDGYQARLGVIFPRLEEVYKSEKFSSVVDPEHMSYIESIAAPLNQGLTEMQSYRRSLDQLVSDALVESPALDNLAKAIKKREQEEDVELARIQDEKVKQYRMESLEKRASVLAEARDSRDESEARKQAAEDAKKRAEAELEAMDQQRDADKIQRQLAREQLELDYERDLPEIKSLLTPFITFGNTQPRFPSNYQNVLYTESYNKPVSLTAIRGAQLLDPDDQASLERLFAFAGHPYNYRHKGGFPTYSEVALRRNATVLKKVKRAQELLIKYGDLMVQKGLLIE